MMSKLSKSKMILNEKTLLVAIDVGKAKNFVYCCLGDGRELKVRSFSNDGKGLRAMWSRVETLRFQSGMTEIVVGYEPTGSYSDPLVHFLKDKKRVKLVQVNPMHTRRVKELPDNSPDKQDIKDPKVIAAIILLGHGLSVVIPEGVRAELRQVSAARLRAVEHRRALLHQLEALVFRIFPEFEKIMKDLKLKSSQYLLGHYPLPGDILTLGEEELIHLLHRLSRGRLGADRASALYQAAGVSGGVLEGAGSIVMEIKKLLSHLELYEKDIAAYEEQLSHLLDQVPEARFIRSIPGIGDVIAAGLIGEIADFNSYQHANELHKLSGLDLYQISSGNHNGQRHISKRGRSALRYYLYLAVLAMIRKRGIMHEIYQHHLKKGMPKHKAMVPIMRKLLSLVFALVRDQREFSREYTGGQKAKKAA